MDRCPAITPSLPLLHAWRCHREEWLCTRPPALVLPELVCDGPRLIDRDLIPFWAFLDRQNRLHPITHPEPAPRMAQSPLSTRPFPASAPSPATPGPVQRARPAGALPARVVIAVAPIRASAIDVFA